MRLVAFDMPWKEVVQSSPGIIIIRSEDCPHCVELEAQLEYHEVDAPVIWIDQKNAEDIFQQFPVFSGSVDVLPFAGIFSKGKCVNTVRAATIKRLKDAL